MKKQIINIILLLTMISVCYGEVGTGGGGGLLYPGFNPSSNYGSRFGVGFGFEIFVRHTLIKPDSLHAIDARYAFRSYYSDIDLPSNSVTRFTFTYLTIGLTLDAVRISDIQIYAGPAVSLVTAKAQQRYVNDITESLMIPEILTGAEWIINENFNLFAELGVQFGSVDITSDILSLNGIRFMIGGTMFLTTRE